MTKRLDFENFKGPLVAQSLDVITDPDNTRAVYIHVVNQIPAGPQIEIFRHVLGTPSIQHVRSIKHPLVGLSSHLVASSPMSFFITGSHADSDVITEASISHSAHADDRAGWSSVVHVEVGNLGATTNPSRSVTTSIAFTGSARSQDINQGMTEEELDYPLEWLTGEDVPPCALTAQKAV